MKHRILTRLVVGFALTAAGASVGCSSDDTTPGATSTGGSGGATGGSGGTGGASTGGSAGMGTGGPPGGSGGGTGGVHDSGPDVAVTATFAAVEALLQQRCQGCHNPTLPLPPGISRIDLTSSSDDAGRSLYTRLTSPLPAIQEGQCGYGLGQEGGANGGGDAEAGAGTSDGSIADAAARPNRIAIVPNNLALSYLYQKINGGFEAQNVQPPMIGCGARMPRVFPPAMEAGAVDGGDAAPSAPASQACDLVAGDGSTASCLSSAQIQMVADWITAGAPQN
jgi:hypothetical protein